MYIELNIEQQEYLIKLINNEIAKGLENMDQRPALEIKAELERLGGLLNDEEL